VTALAKAHNPKFGRVYIHCTAGELNCGTRSAAVDTSATSGPGHTSSWGAPETPAAASQCAAQPQLQCSWTALECARPALTQCCPAGLGRAPATALAYMYWLRGWQLPAALEKLTSVRACSPRIEAIRAATADLLTDSTPVDYTIALREGARHGSTGRFLLMLFVVCCCWFFAAEAGKMP